MIRRLILPLLMVAVFVFSVGAQVSVRPDTTSGTMLAAGDSLFALPAATARIFDINELPVIETTATADDTISLGAAKRVEFRTFGSAAAEGVYFKVTESGTAPYRSVVAYVYIGSADSVRINAWR